ncbi:MAG TPA: sulfite exporter TauE/SafE family protein [Polyangiaceae bacterium]|nr:MAG: Sulfite exporter TauE/SafE [Deltaproteobacteria bacterium ADurb.Bin207]HNS99412.1 sulfite exporter TauE/SafE family protein [Polyangiaceae bacterium]HNZ24606.1 sulfite exporter TauE/SafE family protein [Polyangiaceae bacterium]HOD23620.1 sulfite exporter TauE/SafE family protein [Polyangiaceae bacterium]HOE50274.1 sulfite exporter TauE/SafE family protein [Polyangiaceae bacterium]
MWTLVVMYSTVGAVAGVLAGLLGIGGGLVIVPMLVFCFGLQSIADEHTMHLALGTSMASIVFTAFSSASAHHRRKAVDWTVVRRMTAGLLLGTFAGSCVVALLSTRLLKGFFVVFLLYVATQMILGHKPKPSRTLPGSLGMFGAGGFIGVISSWVGIGGGTLSVPFMVWHNVPLKTAIGTSAALGFPIAVAGAVGYVYNGSGIEGRPDWSIGFVYLPALAGIVLVSVLTAPLGVRLAHALPVDKLKKVFAVLLYVVAIRMLFSLF